jgi:hypothetical protein
MNDLLSGLVRRPDVLQRQVGMDLALFDPGAGVMHLLNPIGAAIWHHIHPTRTFKNVADAIVMSTGRLAEDPEEVPGDVNYFVGRLKAEKLLVEAKDAKVGPAKPPVVVQIPDREVSQFQGYARPTFKSFTLDELRKLADIDTRPITRFSDWASTETWTSNAAAD